MNIKQFERISKHYERFFGSDQEPIIFHEVETTDGLHVDVALFAASSKFPHQVIATIGASDYKMPQNTPSLSPYNEYMMFLPADFDMKDEKNKWAVNFLMRVAKYPYTNKTTLSYCHTMELRGLEVTPDFNMTHAQIMFPEACESAEILRVKAGLFKTITFLQVMPITKNEWEAIVKNGPEYLIDKIYPEDGSGTGFLIAAKR